MPLSMLLIFLPLSLVLRSIGVNVYAVSVCLVVVPVAIVNIAIDVVELAPAACNVVPPAAFVLRAVWPHLDAETVSLVSANFQLTLVYGTIREHNFFSELKAFLIEQQV